MKIKRILTPVLALVIGLSSGIGPAVAGETFYNAEMKGTFTSTTATSFQGPVRAKITNTAVSYQAKVTDSVIRVTSVAAARTITLFSAATRTGHVLEITNASGATTYPITIDGYASETIGGVATKVIHSVNGTVKLISDGTNWNILVDSSQPWKKYQGAPVAKTGASTLTIADMLSGIVTLTQSTGATVALTTDTGAAISAGLPSDFAVGDSFEFTIINLSSASADTGTLTAGVSGVTLVGAVIIPSAHSTTIADSSMTFRVRKTATDTYIIYNLG